MDLPSVNLLCVQLSTQRSASPLGVTQHFNFAEQPLGTACMTPGPFP